MTWKVSEIYPPVPEKLTITEWAAEDRPREKLMAQGADSLSSAELLAILIGSGSADESAVDLMKRIMKDCDNNLDTLGRMTIEQLTSYKGIGEAKAISILAACEIGIRRERDGKNLKYNIMNDARDIYEHLLPKVRYLDVEESWLVLLNHNYKHLKTVRLSHGGMTETAVDVRLVIKEAVQCNATVIILAHNHPSGNLHPSKHDDQLTKQINDACKIMRLYFLDHLILTDNGYYSYREEGKI